MMTTRRMFVASTLGLMAAPSYSIAGWNSLHGNEENAWADGGYNLVIGQVTEIATFSGDRGTHKATLNIFATLAGTLDPGASASLKVWLDSGGAETSIKSVPKKRAFVLAVLAKKDYIARDDCTFMPGHSSLVTIEGFGDKRVMDTILKLRFSRHPAEADIPMEFPKEGGDGVKSASPGNK